MTLDPALVSAAADRLAELALAEDGPHDVTSELLAAGRYLTATVRYRDGGVVAGRPFAEAVTRHAGLEAVAWAAADGEVVEGEAVIATLHGDAVALLRAERPMLNLLQRACGIASRTRAYVDAVRGTGCGVLHTRKTAPGLRVLDVHAVLMGGGATHRLGLDRILLVKDNHWRLLESGGPSLEAVLASARERGVAACYVEIESDAQVELACGAGADRLLIDNQPPATVGRWAALARGLTPGIEIEATGGITLDTVRYYAEAGADFVSVGELTASVRASDVALEVVEEGEK